MNILVVEDTDEYQKIISRTLGDYHIVCAYSAEEGLSTLRKQNFDLVIVDITLPERDGYSFISEMQVDTDLNAIPIICLTGRKDITDKVTAFSIGADDFMTKPFDPLELKARVDSKIRKKSVQFSKEQKSVVGEIEIDHARHLVTARGENEIMEVVLTQTEFKILCCLARRPDQVYTRDQLLMAAWGEKATVLDRVVDAHICLLRKKLGSHSHYIKCVTGIGYKLSKQSKLKSAC